MTPDHYQILEASPSATQEEIKRAYAKALRKNQNNQEKLTLINAAYELLSDPKARKEYDGLRAYGGEVEILMNEVQSCFEKQDWSEAIKRLKKVCVLLPDNDAALNQLGLAFTYNQQFENAIKVFTKLTTTSPSIPLYWRNQGVALRKQAEKLPHASDDKNATIKSALNSYAAAHKLEPENQEDYLDVARCYFANKDYVQATKWAERIIGNELDVASLEAVLFLIHLNILINNMTALNNVILRLTLITPDKNEDLRKYVAYRLASVAQDLCSYVFEYKNYGLSKPAAIILQQALVLDKDSEELKEFAVEIKRLADALDELERMDNDNKTPEGLKLIGKWFLGLALKEKTENWDWDLGDAFDLLENFSERELLSHIRSFKQKYPSIYWFADEILDKIESKIATSIGAESSLTKAKDESVVFEWENKSSPIDSNTIKNKEKNEEEKSGCGCLFWIILLIIVLMIKSCVVGIVGSVGHILTSR